MPLIIPANTLSGGYEVANSCRFNDGDSAYMTKTITYGSSSSNRIFTFSAWVKKATNVSDLTLFSSGDNGSTNDTAIRFDNDALQFYQVHDSAVEIDIKTNALYRDPSAWMHVVVAVDTTQGTDTNRVKVYVNGTQVTSLSGTTYPDQNDDLVFNMGIDIGDGEHDIGREHSTPRNYFDGYMEEVCWIDWTQYAASDFWEFDEDSPTIWKPKNVSGLTFGNNGAYLDFEDSSNLGNDANGGTDFTESNLAATDQATDTPTNNFCTFNPLSTLSGPTLSEGNTQFDHDNGDAATFGTMGMANGKWYWEIKALGADVDSVQKWTPGIIGADDHTLYSNRDGGYAPKATSVYLGNGNVYENNSSVSSDYDTAAQNDIISIAVDMDNLKIYFAKNGTWMNSGDPTSGATGTGAVALTASFAPYLPIVGEGSGAAISFAVNFGNPPYTISSGNAAADGYGNFEYAPPSGYYALCTKNLAEYG